MEVIIKPYIIENVNTIEYQKIKNEVISNACNLIVEELRDSGDIYSFYVKPVIDLGQLTITLPKDIGDIKDYLSISTNFDCLKNKLKELNIQQLCIICESFWVAHKSFNRISYDYGSCRLSARFDGITVLLHGIIRDETEFKIKQLHDKLNDILELAKDFKEIGS